MRVAFFLVSTVGYWLLLEFLSIYDLFSASFLVLGTAFHFVVATRWFAEWRTLQKARRVALNILRSDVPRLWNKYTGRIRVAGKGKRGPLNQPSPGRRWRGRFFCTDGTIELKNGLRIPSRMKGAVSLERIRNNDPVTVWGYHHHGFNVVWVAWGYRKAPNVATHFLFWSRTLVALTVLHLFFIIHTLFVAGFVEQDLYNLGIIGLVVSLIAVFLATVLALFKELLTPRKGKRKKTR